ncbi:MAG: group II intron reverse transcriptase/maturase [Chloroflexota bacterium]
MADTTHDEMVRRKQYQLFYTAINSPELKFTALYGLILWDVWLKEALKQVLSNKGAKTPGVDGVTKDDLKTEEAQIKLLDDLAIQLKDGSYQPQPVKRVYIPKANGKLRPLGIPTIRDRVIQAAVKNLMEPIFEADFKDCSYGFRPNRGCWDALAEIGQYLKRPSNYEWVVEGDIHDCFGSIDHDILMKQVRRRISDNRLLTLIWLMLKAGVMEDLRYYSAAAGTPQGGIVSPLLANIYMHQLDEWAAKHSHNLTVNQRYSRRTKGYPTLRLTRYADDFVISVKGTREQAEAIRDEIANLLKTKMRMELSLDKTLITNRTDGFVFLGIKVGYGQSHIQQDSEGKGKWNVYYLPSEKAIKRYKEKVSELTNRQVYSQDEVEIIRSLNRFIKGWCGYYQNANSSKTFSTLTHWTWHRVFHWLRDLHQMGMKEAFHRFYVAPNIPINKHPTRKDKRLGTWDDKGRHYALWPPDLIPIRYWKYRGNNIPLKFAEVLNVAPRQHPSLPNYDVEPWPIGGDNPRDTAEYRNSREIVWERDRSICQKCKDLIPKGEGHVHHIDGNPTNNDPENMELLCFICHTETVTYGRRKKKELP